MLSSTGQVQYYDIPQMLKNADVLALCRPANHHQAEGGFPTKMASIFLQVIL